MAAIKTKIKALEVDGKALPKGVVICDAGDAKDAFCSFPVNLTAAVGDSVSVTKWGDCFFAKPAEAEAPAAPKK